MLKNMKQSGLRTHELADAFKKEIRSILEMAVPVWHPGLTLEQSILIERVQKASLAAILGHKYNTYEDALKQTGLERLSIRRQQLCSKFINKNMKSDDPLLKLVTKVHSTRSNPNCVKEFKCRTKSMYDSSLPYLARLYNKNLQK